MLAIGWTLTAALIGMAAPKSRKAKASTNVSDATVTKNVEARLARTRSLKTVPIHVETQKGVVTLTGTVAKWWMKGVATREAKMIAGVKKVNDQLKIAPGGMPRRRKKAKKSQSKS
jgi:osmotically-inducible protein OsmY